MSDLGSVLTRWLGIGLAAIVCVVTIGLTVTGRIGMYINPDSAWFATGMAVLGLVVIVATFVLPLGEETDHGHDHGHAHAPGWATSEEREHAHVGARSLRDDAADRLQRLRAEAERPSENVRSDIVAEAPVPGSRRAMRAAAASAAPAEVAPVEDVPAEVAPTHVAPTHVAPTHIAPMDASHPAAHSRPRPLTVFSAALGGLLATGVVGLMLVLPPQALSAQAAADRDIGSPPLFGGEETVTLAASGDLGSFGVGEWASVFATAGNPAAYDGVEITLTGFLTEGESGARLSRLVVTHCVIDAQPASLDLAADGDADALLQSSEVGAWLQVDGTVREQSDGSLVVVPTTVTAIDQPADPYEY